jgi:hypothetical protein
MRGPSYENEDFMASEKEYRDILSSISFCPECRRMIFFDKWWGLNDSDKEIIKGLMRWSEWNEWNQYDDKRNRRKRWEDEHSDD